MKSKLLLGAALCALTLLAACNVEINDNTGPTVTDPISVALGKADRANVELNMSAGQLKVAGGATKLLEGTVEYNVAGWKPKITTSENGIHSTITMRQPEGGSGVGSKARNNWDLQLSNKPLLDLKVNCGAGEALLRLGALSLRSIDVAMGAGKVDLNLKGNPQHDYDVTINGGVGEAKVHLPEGVGIWATAHGGIGDIKVTGLTKHGDHWENDLYNKAKVNVHVEVTGGIGSVSIIG